MSMPAPLDADDQAPEYDYPHLPGEQLDPLMESTVHSAWCMLLVQSARHTLADTDALVTGNTPFVPSGANYHTAPDLMVVPGMRGREFGSYVVDEHGAPPSVCVELVDGAIVRSDALGCHSPAMRMAFTRVDDRLGLCCPGGRVVAPDDDPYGWLVEERHRADAELEQLRRTS